MLIEPNMAKFDPYEKNSWFFGTLTRNEAIDILTRENDKGVFLVRNSTSIAGDLVLSVSEENKISHYIINKVELDGGTKFRIGENTFHDLPTLLTFYKHHYLDTTPLIRTATKNHEYVRAKFEFLGKDKEDLPFKKNEILTVISKDEGQWWTAKNEKGMSGSIPVPYVEIIDEDEYLNEKGKLSNNTKSDENRNSFGEINHNHVQEVGNSDHSRNSMTSSNSSASINSQLSNNIEPKMSSINFDASNGIGKKPTPNINRKLPAKAVVIQKRIPNPYDKKALTLEKGDIILVTSTNITGQWEGELNGKQGHFPFNYIQFLDEEQDNQPVN